MLKKMVVLMMMTAVLGSSGVCIAGSRDKGADKGAAQETQRTAGKVSLEEAQKIALASYPGTILEAESEDALYEIKIKTDKGESIKVKVDPADGSIVSFKKKRK